MRTQERMPWWKLASSYFSLGLWMRLSSSPKPARITSMPRTFLISTVTGMEPPPPMNVASLPHSSDSAFCAFAKAGALLGKRIARLAP